MWHYSTNLFSFSLSDVVTLHKLHDYYTSKSSQNYKEYNKHFYKDHSHQLCFVICHGPLLLGQPYYIYFGGFFLELRKNYFLTLVLALISLVKLNLPQTLSIRNNLGAVGCQPHWWGYLCLSLVYRQFKGSPYSSSSFQPDIFTHLSSCC